MIRTMLALLLALLLAAVAGAQETRQTPPAELDGAALAEHLRTKGCPGCEIAGKDLSGQNLDGANLEGAHLNEVDLHGATCHGCNLKGASLGSRVQLDGADLDGADLRDLTAECSPFFAYMQCQGSIDGGQVTLRKANLEGADLSGIIDLDVSGARAEGATFYVGFPPTLVQATFDKVYLAPEYGSEADKQPFDATEIRGLAGFVQHNTASWIPLALDFGEVDALAHAPSFDCAKAGNDTEKALCKNDSLALKDRMLSAAYKAARDAPGLDREALKKEQLAWMKTRNACGAEWVCLEGAMSSRITALVVLAGSSAAVRTGRYEPSYAEPRIWTGVAASETGAKLRKLMRYDATSLDVKRASGGVLSVEAFALGGNGHMCTIEENTEFHFDPATGRYRPVGDDIDPTDEAGYGTILAVDRYLIFEGGMYWCGARASLAGIYVLPEK